MAILTLALVLLPADVVTDVVATTQFYADGDTWWGTISAVALYLSLRFQLLVFFLTHVQWYLFVSSSAVL